MDKKSIIKFNDNTSLGTIRKYCSENNKIFELSEKGFLFFDLIPDPQKEEDILSLKKENIGHPRQIHIKNSGKEKFSDFGKKKRYTKKERMRDQIINIIIATNKTVETGHYKNSWGEKFPYKKLSDGTLVAYYPDMKKVKMVINNFGRKNYY